LYVGKLHRSRCEKCGFGSEVGLLGWVCETDGLIDRIMFVAIKVGPKFGGNFGNRFMAYDCRLSCKYFGWILGTAIISAELPSEIDE
jgi:hypothetical protein